LVTVALGTTLLFGTLVHAQQQASSPPPPPPAYGAPITLEQARAAIAAGEAESKKNGWNHVFAVVDGGGNLIAFEKADLAGNSSIEIAQAKAKTAATFRVQRKLTRIVSRRAKRSYWDYLAWYRPPEASSAEKSSARSV
jgi:Haem degrading protein HbpS-like